MHKYYTDLDDFEDGSRSRLLDITERWLIPGVIFVGCVIVILGTCGVLEVL